MEAGPWKLAREAARRYHVPMFKRDVYVERRTRLAASLGGGLALFLGNDEAPMNYGDNHYPFRQDSTFLYFWGLAEAGLAGVLDLDSGQETLYGVEPTLDDIVWTGPLPTLAERGERIGVAECRNVERLAADLQEAMDGGRTIHALPPYRGDTKLKLARLLGVEPRKVGRYVSNELIDAIIPLRAVKEKREVTEIERALAVSWETHTLAMRETRPGRREAEVVQEVEACHARHGSPLSFPIILSVRGEVLHNHGHGNVMEAGQMVVHDSGATSAAGYASDITRTFPVSGTFDSRQREIYEIVLGALDARVLDILGGKHGYRDRHILHALRAFPRGDHHFFQLCSALCRRQHGD